MARPTVSLGGGTASVLVSHPGRQHSHQAALALAEQGMLAGYWAGIPGNLSQQAWIPEALRARFIRYAPVAIPQERARWFPVAVALRRLGRLSRMQAIERPLDFAACRAFDKRIARYLEDSGAGAVIACEISALDTFRAARRLGMRTILDAPSVHFSTQDRVSPTLEPAWLHERVLRVKNAEIGLADHIVTVSELARDTYIHAGVPHSRVHAVALGADTCLFLPEDHPAGQRFTFVFAGTTMYRKGVDVLLEAFDRMQQRVSEKASLLLIGPRGDAHHLIGQSREGVVVLPPVSQPELQKVFSGADCFVLPSRHDSFGMVVAEAMACGLPPIVSTMVGAKDLIEEGRNGWVVPADDVAALADRLAWCVEHREEVRAMRGGARSAAERHDWVAYRRRFSDLIRVLIRAGA